LYIEQKIIRTGKLEDLTTEELESRMKQIIDEYSPILEGVEIEELVDKVKQEPKELENQTQILEIQSDTTD
jgi:predicted patatin/cPLA2 family phospholipase